MQQPNKEATVFWLGGIQKIIESILNLWTQELETLLPKAQPPALKYHCTLQYFQTTKKERNDKWLKKQPSTVPITLRNVIIGPQGAAAMVDETPYLEKQFSVENSLPHVTLLVNPGYRARDLGPMVKAVNSQWEPTSRPLVWTSEGKKYTKFQVIKEGLSTPQAIRLPERGPERMTATERWTEMMAEVPQQLWAAHETDVGLIKSAQAVQVTLRPGCQPPLVRQYHLKKDTEAGIKPTIKGLLKALPRKFCCLFPSRKLYHVRVNPVTALSREKLGLQGERKLLTNRWSVLSGNPNPLGIMEVGRGNSDSLLYAGSRPVTGTCERESWVF